MKAISLLVVTGCIGAPAVAGAQVCNGLAPFQRGPLHALATTTKMHGVIRVVGGVALGNRTVFGRLGVGRNSLQGRPGAAVEIAGSGGVEFPGGPRQTVRVCMVGAFSVTPVPNSVPTVDPNGTQRRVDFSSVDWSVGVTASAVRSIRQRPLLFPTGSVMIVSATTRVKDQYSGVGRSDLRVFGIMEAGVGVVLAQAITVRPVLTIPVGLPRASYGGSVTVSTTLGGKRGPGGTRF